MKTILIDDELHKTLKETKKKLNIPIKMLVERAINVYIRKLEIEEKD
jgi:predicted transcriptional regulator